jgi:SnoaL-like domain
MGKFERAEVEEAFRRYFMTGPVQEDWHAWSQLFTDDATYWDHYWGTFRGPAEIERFLDSTMSFAPGVYTPIMWYVIDDDRVVWKGINRADNPDPDGEELGFMSLQLMQYAGDGKWKSEEDWWIAHEMKLFGQKYAEVCAKVDPDFPAKMTRKDWGPWVDWARPEEGHVAKPSWLGRADITPIRNVREMDFGIRNPK